MNTFKALTGIETSEVRPTVVLLPFIPADALIIFGIKKLTPGALFAAASTDSLTVIKTGMSAGRVGDAVLYLKDTPAERIILLGTCGLLAAPGELDIGSPVIPMTAAPMESFSDMLVHGIPTLQRSSPDEKLVAAFRAGTGVTATPVSCISIASLYLEESLLPFLKRTGTMVIDMECAALYNAARAIRKPAMALLVISDIPGEKPFYAPPLPRDKKSLAHHISQACHAITKISMLL